MSDRDLITDEHVKAALRTDKGVVAVLNSWEFEDFTKKGDNYGSTVTSVKLWYSIQKQKINTSYVVKINNYGEGSYEGFKALSRAMFEKEVQFFEKIYPDINAQLTVLGQAPLRMPQQLHYSLEEGKEFLFLEDLRLQGFKMYDRTKGLDVPHALLVLKEMARLHAASVVLQANSPHQDLEDKYETLKINWHNFSDKAEEFFNFMFSSGIEGCLNVLRNIDGYERAVDWLNKHKENSVAVFKKHIGKNPTFDVICHGDCWNNNFLFRYSEDGKPVEVMLLDLQLNCKASVCTDLTYLMFTGFFGDVRTTNLNTFLKQYYSTFDGILQGAGIPIQFTYDQLLEEFKEKHEYGLLFICLFADALMRPSEEIPDFNPQNEEEFKQQMQEFNAGTKACFETNPNFKSRFLAIFDEIFK